MGDSPPPPGDAPFGPPRSPSWITRPDSRYAAQPCPASTAEAERVMSDHLRLVWSERIAQAVEAAQTFEPGSIAWWTPEGTARIKVTVGPRDTNETRAPAYLVRTKAGFGRAWASELKPWTEDDEAGEIEPARTSSLTGEYPPSFNGHMAATESSTVKFTPAVRRVLNDIASGGSERLAELFPYEVPAEMPATPELAEAIGWAFEWMSDGSTYTAGQIRAIAALYVKLHHLDPSGDEEHLAKARRLAGVTGVLAERAYEGEIGNRDHITLVQTGTIPTAAIAHLLGARGEVPGGHRNRQGADWEAFKADIDAHGIHDPIFITVDFGQAPVINEGNHRRDAAVELGLAEVPVEIRYFGHAEKLGRVGS